MGEFSPWHLLIVAFVFVVLFGSKRLPDAARSLGRSMRILKAETAGLRNDQDPTPDTHHQGQHPTIAEPSQLIPIALSLPQPTAIQPVDAPAPIAAPQPLISQPA